MALSRMLLTQAGSWECQHRVCDIQNQHFFFMYTLSMYGKFFLDSKLMKEAR